MPLEGARLTLATGLQRMMDGFEALEAENLDAARDAFGAAEQAFEPLSSRYEALEDDPDLPRHMEADVIELSCIAEAMHEGATLAKEGAEAGLDDDWDTFNDRLEEAGAAMDRC